MGSWKLSRSGDRLRAWLPGAVLAFGTLVSVSGYLLYRDSLESGDRERFGREVGDAMDEIRGRLRMSERALEGLRGLFAASRSVERTEWRSYVASLRQEDYPGTLGFGYIRKLEASDRDSFLAEMRRDGAPGFAFSRIRDTGVAYVVGFIEPPRPNAMALGMDISFDARRKQAADEATRSGKTRITRPIRLMQDTGAGVGFLMLLPIPRNGRVPRTDPDSGGADILGWAYAPVKASEIMRGIEQVERGQVLLKVGEGDDAAGEVIHQDAGWDSARGGAVGSMVATMDIYGRRWQIQAAPGPRFESHHAGPVAWLLLISGLVLSSLSALAIYLSRATRIRAEEMAKAMTLDLHAALVDAQKANEAAREAEAAAAGANQAKSDFLATMSHEIRTPLNGVLATAQLLGHTRLEPEQRELLQGLIVSGDTLLSLINDILDYSKIEAGRLELESLPFDAQELAESTLEILAEQARAKGISLTLRYPRQVPSGIQGDATRVRQVLFNLLGNALKFTPRGGAVELRAESEGGALRFRVEDSGPGVPSQHQARLFRNFSQVDASTARRFGGTGLGLAISKRLVEAMGGQIGYRTSGLGGAEFWFSLPLPAVPEPGAPPRQGLGGRRVLVSAPSSDVRERLNSLLSDWQCVPIDGGEAAPHWDAAVLVPGSPEELPGQVEALRSRPGHGSSPILVLDDHGLVPAAGKGAEACLGYHVIRHHALRPSRLIAAIVGAGSAASPSPAESRDAEEPIGSPLLGQRLLLVDDNPVNLKVTAALLRRLGGVVETAMDGFEALSKLKQRGYDATLMDWEMPELDGLAATRIFRAWERESSQGDSSDAARRAVIFALTANAVAGDREKCLDAGMDGYLSKPLRQEELVRLLGRRGGSGG